MHRHTAYSCVTRKGRASGPRCVLWPAPWPALWYRFGRRVGVIAWASALVRALAGHLRGMLHCAEWPTMRRILQHNVSAIAVRAGRLPGPAHGRARAEAAGAAAPVRGCVQWQRKGRGILADGATAHNCGSMCVPHCAYVRGCALR